MSGSVPVDAAHLQASSSSLWDRVSNWVSDNKAVAYTIAGTAVVVTGAGVVYYISDSRRSSAAASSEKRKSKKERRKEKKEAEEAQKKPGIALKDEEAGKYFCHRQDSSY